MAIFSREIEEEGIPRLPRLDVNERPLELDSNDGRMAPMLPIYIHRPAIHIASWPWTELDDASHK